MPRHPWIAAAALAAASAAYGGEPAATSPAAAPAAAAPAAKPVAAPTAAMPIAAPKIINVAVEPAVHRELHPHNDTADRAMLMREFPDDLVERMWIQDWTDLERMHQVGGLVDIRSDPNGRGIVLRLDGPSRIGELVDDAYRQSLLCRLRRPAAGLLYRIASRMRLMEGEAYEPLEITSLVRTWDYQLQLTDVNPNADRTRDGVPPTHVLGLAFDIARTRMSDERQRRIEFLFAQLAADGELAYYKEGSSNGLMHYHVIALPRADSELAREYERGAHQFDRGGYEIERRLDSVEPRFALPDAPCVTFGTSLEPFSAICSCELPIEVAAAVATIELTSAREPVSISH